MTLCSFHAVLCIEIASHQIAMLAHFIRITAQDIWFCIPAASQQLLFAAFNDTIPTPTCDDTASIPVYIVSCSKRQQRLCGSDCIEDNKGEGICTNMYSFYHQILKLGCDP